MSRTIEGQARLRGPHVAAVLALTLAWGPVMGCVSPADHRKRVTPQEPLGRCRGLGRTVGADRGTLCRVLQPALEVWRVAVRGKGCRPRQD